MIFEGCNFGSWLFLMELCGKMMALAAQIVAHLNTNRGWWVIIWYQYHKILHYGKSSGKDHNKFCNCTFIQFVNSFKYFGVVLGEKLTWNRHIINILHNTNSKYPFFNKCTYFTMNSVLSKPTQIQQQLNH